MCLGPHCQCESRFGKRLPRGTRREAVRLHRIGPDGKRHVLRVSVPLWVSRSPLGKSAFVPGKYTPPRVHFRNRVVPPAPHLGVEDTSDMFRDRVRPSRPCPGHVFATQSKLEQSVWATGMCPCAWKSACQVSHSLVAVAEVVHNAVATVQDWAESLHASINDVLRGGGLAGGVPEALRCMAQCWDWSFLLFNRPTAQHVRSFKQLLTMLLPYLKFCAWPESPEYKQVERSWNVDRVCGEYLVLISRVRWARVKCPSISKSWLQVACYHCVAVCVSPLVERFVHAWFLKHDLVVQRGEVFSYAARVAFLLTRFVDLGGSAPGPVGPGGCAPGSVFKVAPLDLRVPGFPWQNRQRHSRIKWPYFRGREGSIGTIGKGKNVGKVVMVARVEYHVDCSAVSASIDLE